MNQERVFNILLSAHISEKVSMAVSGYPQYAFKVSTTANKKDIKQAVETLFNVNVHKVRVLNVTGKTARFGKTQGRHSDWKKAYVTLKPGQEIDISRAVQ